MERRNYPLHVPHEYRVNACDIHATLKLLDKSNPDELRQVCQISANRMALLPIARELLRRLLKTFTPKYMAISSHGLREVFYTRKCPKKCVTTNR